MTRDTFRQRLDLLSPRQESKMTALVEEYRRDVADVQSVAIRDSERGDSDRRRAFSLIAQLGETIVGSLVSMITAQTPVPETMLLIDAVQGLSFAEAMVTGRLKAALTDTRVVPQPPEMQALEEVGPPYRVCDEAYTALRRILNPESYLQHLMEARHFLSLPDPAKTREIEFYLQTRLFTRFLGDVDVEEE